MTSTKSGYKGELYSSGAIYPDNATSSESAQIPLSHDLTRDQLNSFPPSRAEFKETKKCIESFDESLTEDPNALCAFFLSHLTKPQVEIIIRGAHSGPKNNVDPRYPESGYPDFRIAIDISHLVNEWTSLATHAIDEKGNRKTLSNVLQEFTNSENSFKQISVRKWIDWNAAELEKAIDNMIRSTTGYKHFIWTTFQVKQKHITVNSSSSLAKASQSGFIWCLCVVSCLWILCLPVYRLSREKIDGKLLAHYPMAITEKDFYERNAVKILEAVTTNNYKANWVCP